VGPVASGPAASFPGCSSADIEDPKVSVPASVPASIAGAQLRNCELRENTRISRSNIINSNNTLVHLLLHPPFLGLVLHFQLVPCTF
jgi:hypothetical protein